jgi:hypothetical protein
VRLLGAILTIDSIGEPRGLHEKVVSMTAPKAIFEAFSISHAQILDGDTSFIDTAFGLYDEDLDIYGVSEGTLTPDTATFENQGDDDTLSRWNWVNFVDVAVKAGYISLPLLSSITGRPIETIVDATAAGAGGPKPQNNVIAMDLWHEDDSNVNAKPMILKCPSRDSRGAARDLIIGLYSVTNLGTMTFDGPVYKDGLKMNLAGTAVRSLYDEKGVAFPDGKKRAGRLLSIGRAKPVTT